MTRELTSMCDWRLVKNGRHQSGFKTAFFDEPRRADEQADSVVADVMKRLAEGFANEEIARTPVGSRRQRHHRATSLCQGVILRNRPFG
jgi:hypothetical protein